MQGQKRTDTSFGCPIVGRREYMLNQNAHRERLAKIKSSLDTNGPTPQPHLTLYGRDYVQKKKATTEAAFSDLKMIQAIARTMTRKHEITERRGPVSLNADYRKAEIYRVMHENHKLLDQIENVGAICSAKELVKEYRDRQRYTINASHTMRRSGEYDAEIAKFKHGDAVRLEVTQRSTQLRKEAAQRLSQTTGSVSLPSLVSAGSSQDTALPARSSSSAALPKAKAGSQAAKAKGKAASATPAAPPALASGAYSPVATSAGRPAVRFAEGSDAPSAGEPERDRAKRTPQTPHAGSGDAQEEVVIVEDSVAAPAARAPVQDAEAAQP